MQAPCYNCPDRTIECHGKCEKYKEFKQFIKDKKSRDAQRDFDGYLNDSIRRMKRR